MSFNTPHLLATGLMLLAAFLVGATLGLMLRRIFDRMTRRAPKAAAALHPMVAAMPTDAGSAEPAPHAEPLGANGPEVLDPVVAIDRHVKAPMRPVFSIPELPPLVPATPVQRASLLPARRAGETAAGRPVWSPYQPVDPPVRPRRVRADGASATIIPFPAAVSEPPVALVEELEQLMSTPVPVPVAAAIEPVATAESLGGAEDQPMVAEDTPALVAPPEPPAPPAAVPPVMLTGIPLGLEAQMANAMSFELDIPVAVPPSEPEGTEETAQLSEPSPPDAIALAAPDMVAGDLVEAFAPEPVTADIPDVLPEPEPVAQVDEADAVLSPEPRHVADLVVQEPDPSPSLDARIEPDLAEAVAEAEPEPEPLTVPEPRLVADEVVSDEEPGPEGVARIEPDIVEPVAEAEAEAEVAPGPVPEPVVDPDEAPLPERDDWTDTDEAADEAAAMRAIEGNWTPRRPSAPVAKPIDPPDGIALSPPAASAVDALAASAAAVASARRTARAIMEDVSPHSARPSALPGPRDGKADDLTQIIGVLPVVESALNRLGVYHYDQIAAWGADTVNWVETYLGLEGRIGREHWRLQAHELAEARPPRPSTGARNLAKAGE